MKYIKFIVIAFVIASAGYLVAKEYAGFFLNNEKSNIDNTAISSESIPDGVVMYYFHSNRRCPTCMAIERYAREATEPYMNNNNLTWETVNVESYGNKHFIDDFKINSSGPVIVEYRNGKVQRWQALDKVWQLVRDKTAFMKYVDDEVRGFIR